jgi:predicted metallo-beta-lactamase superfamily hydrolase
LLSEEPDILIIGGPPTYLQGFKVGDEFFQIALRNLQRLAESIQTVVIDHHLLRDAGWYEFLAPVRESAEKADHRILTASELLKTKPNVLECQRQQLYERDKPSAEFVNWTRLPEDKQSVTPPPLGSA